METGAQPNDVAGRASQEDDRFEARATVAEVRIGALLVRSLEAVATAGCAGGAGTRSGRSRVLSLTIAGQEVGGGDAPLNLTLPGVGTLHLNETVDTPEGLTVRALRLESALGEVVVAEARVGLGAPPCASGLITIRRESSSPDAGPSSFTGDLGHFLLDGSGPGGPALEQTFRRPPGRYRIEEAAPAGETGPLEAVECRDPTGPSSRVDLPARAVTIDLSNGGDVVCTFRHARPSRRRTGVLGAHIEAELNPPPRVAVLGCRVEREASGDIRTQHCPAAPPATPRAAGAPEPTTGHLGMGVAKQPPSQPAQPTRVDDRPGWPLPVLLLALALLLVLVVWRRRRQRAET